MSSPTWYRPRKYPHFDLPAPEAEAIKLATSPSHVQRHSFWPFIAYDFKRRRYKVKDEKAVVSTKKRPIRIASHHDGYILAYYAWTLSQRYEQRIAGTALAASVLAYRKSLGSSIDFAMGAFDEIATRPESVVFAFDLEGFFDSIDHVVLKKEWSKTLGTPLLPPDSYAIYRAVTKYATVNRDECLKALGLDPKKKKTIPRPICNSATFNTVIRKGKLIRVNDLSYGIPQGSPISAVLSNVYMVPFDEAICAWALGVGGYYRRYCDDILIVVPPEHAEAVPSVIANALVTQGGKLAVNDGKTTITHFKDGKIIAGPLLQYLGFTFDGEHRLIRSQTLSKFWRRVVYGVRAAKNRARKKATAGTSLNLFKRKLYRRFTHLGKRNFLTYARRAWTVGGDKSIRRQMRRHWERLQQELRRS